MLCKYVHLDCDWKTRVPVHYMIFRFTVILRIEHGSQFLQLLQWQTLCCTMLCRQHTKNGRRRPSSGMPLSLPGDANCDALAVSTRQLRCWLSGLNRMDISWIDSGCDYFLLSHSVETALLHTMDCIYLTSDQCRPTILDCVDVTYTYDMVDHNVLLSRLYNSFGISGSAFFGFVHISEVTHTDQSSSAYKIKQEEFLRQIHMRSRVTTSLRHIWDII